MIRKDCREAVVAYFKFLSLSFLGSLIKIVKHLSKVVCPAQDSDRSYKRYFNVSRPDVFI
jgi:hypothetical protein